MYPIIRVKEFGVRDVRVHEFPTVSGNDDTHRNGYRDWGKRLHLLGHFEDRSGGWEDQYRAKSIREAIGFLKRRYDLCKVPPQKLPPGWATPKCTYFYNKGSK